MIPEFLELLERSKAIHIKKNSDYAAQTNQFENFERSAQLMRWFEKSHDKAFVCLIATKLARLATLLDTNKTPNNESIDDSFLDLFTYVGLWAAYNKRLLPVEKKINENLARMARIENELSKPTYPETSD